MSGFAKGVIAYGIHNLAIGHLSGAANTAYPFKFGFQSGQLLNADFDVPQMRHCDSVGLIARLSRVCDEVDQLPDRFHREIQITGSKRYIRVCQLNEATGEYVRIPLDAANV